MSKIKQEYLECKAWNHAWEPIALPKSRTTLADALHLCCTRCGSEKDQGIGRGGYLDSTTMRLDIGYRKFLDEYPDMTRAEAREELFKIQHGRKYTLSIVS